MKFLIGIFILFISFSSCSHEIIIHDASRMRNIPISVNFPINTDSCTSEKKCKVAFISAGNGVPYTKYSFITESMNAHGFMTVAINHELPNDPLLSKSGDLYKTRIENWQRGSETIYFIQKELSSLLNAYDFKNLVLVGHSNGGDISTWVSQQEKNYIRKLITLDNMRVTLPKSHHIKVLSIRASEYSPTNNILPTNQEQSIFDSCVVDIPNSKHMDLTDFGTTNIKAKTKKIILGFLDEKNCHQLKKEGLLN